MSVVKDNPMSKIQTDRLAIVYCPILLLMIVAGCSAHRDQPAGVKTTPISTRPSPSLHKDKPLQSELEVTFRPASVTLDGATYRYAVYVPAITMPTANGRRCSF
jgi:hypothetical protein